MPARPATTALPNTSMQPAMALGLAILAAIVAIHASIVAVA